MSNKSGKALVFWYDGADKYYEYESIEDLKEYIQACHPEVSGYMILEEVGDELSSERYEYKTIV